MHLISSEGLSSVIKGKILLIDNDFLSVISKDAEAFEDFRKLTEGFAELVLDPLTKFEFLHGMTTDRRKTMSRFIAQDMFIEATINAVVFMPIIENAKKLSKVSATANCNHGSPIDILIASRAIYQQYLLVTGNRKDFPYFALKTIGNISYEEGNKEKTVFNYHTFGILQFDKASYETAAASSDKREA